jgi:hypothetical protein
MPIGGERFTRHVDEGDSTASCYAKLMGLFMLMELWDLAETQEKARRGARPIARRLLLRWPAHGCESVGCHPGEASARQWLHGRRTS